MSYENNIALYFEQTKPSTAKNYSVNFRTITKAEKDFQLGNHSVHSAKLNRSRIINNFEANV